MFRRPPALAVWLLDRLGYIRQNPALAGDLLEEFRNGRSAGWYWRQTFAVIANGFRRNITSLVPYLLAVSAGYAAQFASSYALWSLRFPREVHSSGWGRVGLYALMQAAANVAVAAPVKWILGQGTVRLRPMFLAAGADGRKRQTILTLAGYDSFSFGLWSYCLCAMVFWHFSEAEFSRYELIWFVLWVLGPAVLPALAVPGARASQPVEDREPWLAIPQSEPLITVTLRDGRAITLERDRLAESIFAASDPELIRVAFGRGQSLDLLRRAVWLGGYRSRSHIQGRAESFTLAELGGLIEEADRAKSVTEAWYPTNRRESVRLRLKVWFCGDSF